MQSKDRAITPKERITAQPKERILNYYERPLDPRVRVFSSKPKPQTLIPKARISSPAKISAFACH